ncbi:MAG: hypothetical protein ACXVXI_02870 [Mycobacteriaceae bacterium]
MTPGLGAFGVVRTNGRWARLIQLVTHSTVNHAFIHVGHGRIVEANPDGADLGTLAEYPHAIWDTMPLTDTQREAVVAAAVSLLGTPYSWVDCACIGLADLFGWHVPEPVRHRLNRRDRLMCSQLVDVAYQRAGIHLFPDGRVPGDVAPSDLYGLIEDDARASS